MRLTAVQRERAAELLREAEATRAAVPPLGEAFPGIDVTDAYAIQLLNARRRCDEGATVYGYKVGLTSKAMQALVGVEEPDFGHLLSDMVLREDEPIDMGRFLQPKLEAEIAFVLGEDLPVDGCTVDDVLRCTAFVAPAIELVDSRIANWRIGLCDTVADNASSCGVVLGTARAKPDELDLAAVEAVLEIGGRQVAVGRGDAVLGNPALAVAWLADTVASYGLRVPAGAVVLPGSCTPAHDAAAGDQVVARFSGLGSVSVSFSADRQPGR